ncbi:hypothetical protein ACFO4O_04395 [Glaciecola siphonariae]|uniref:SGNH/GDSL hydrolase family protein n=1 Tax=Glaciecola siphonariae TaxID=521012 RepID=A0ABV9LUT0_9ALTE
MGYNSFGATNTFEGAVGQTPQQPSGTRYFPRGGSVAGLNITLAAGEKLTFQFMVTHTDSFLELLSGTNTSIQINKGDRTDAAVRFVVGGNSTFFPAAQFYSHGCFNTLELTAGTDPTDITVTMNGNSLGTKSIGSTGISVNNLGTGVYFVRRLAYSNASNVEVLAYEFTESSGTTASPSVGSGNLTFATAPTRYEFTLTNGVWESDPSGFPDDVRIRIPDDAAKYRSAPLGLSGNVTFIWGYGQSLGKNFLNGANNERRVFSTVPDSFAYSGVNPPQMAKYAPRIDLAGAGHAELTMLTDATTKQFVYANTAKSSSSLLELSKGTDSYDDFLGSTGELSSADGVLPTGSNIEELYFFFTHGEKDTSGETSLSNYKQQALTLFDDVVSDARTVLNNASLSVTMIYTQVGRATSYRDIQQAHYDLANKDNFIFAGPRWPLNQYYNDKLDTPPDGVHLSPLGYAVLSEMHAQAIIDSNWQPLTTSAAVSDIANQSQVVTVSCNVQTLPLRKYDDVTDPSLGVYYVNATGTEFGVSGVSFSGSNIIVDTGRTVEAGAKIRFGSTSRSSSLPLINIMDSTEWLGADSRLTLSHVMPIHDVVIAQQGENTQPTVNLSGPTTATSGQVLTFTVTTNDIDGDAVSVALSASSGVVLSAITNGTFTATMPTVSSGNQSVTITATPNDGTENGTPVERAVLVSAVVTPSQPQQEFNVAASTNGEMDLFYQNVDNAFASGVLDKNGEYVDLSIYVGAEYCIYDRLGNKDVELTLGNGIVKQGTDFVIQISDTAMDFAGLRQHQLIAVRANGQRDLIFKRRLTVVETC